MAGLSGIVTNALVSRVQSTADGVNARISAITAADPSVTAGGIRSVSTANTPIDLAEKSGQAVYPSLALYCSKVTNTQQEKFRTFSGTAQMVVDIRHSQTQLAGIETQLQVYVDAVCALLDDSRGDWDDGTFYSGGYEVTYDPVVQGGKNYLQRARVGFEVEVSR